MAILLDSAFCYSFKRRGRQRLMDQPPQVEDYEVLALSEDISHVCRSLGSIIIIALISITFYLDETNGIIGELRRRW